MKGGKKSRREFLQAGAIGVGTIAAPSFATASRRRHGGTAKEGVDDEVTELLKNGEAEKARHVLDEYGIEAAVSQVEFSKDSEAITSQNVTAQDEWGKSESSFNRATWTKDASNNLYKTVFTWHLQGGGCQCDGAGPNDGVGITLNPDVWRINTGSKDSSGHASLDKRDERGRLWEYNDPSSDSWFRRQDSSGYCELEMYRSENDYPATIYGTYAHTWVPFGIPGWASFGLQIGPISLQTSGRVDSWKARVDHEVKPDGTIEEVRH